MRPSGIEPNLRIGAALLLYGLWLASSGCSADDTEVTDKDAEFHETIDGRQSVPIDEGPADGCLSSDSDSTVPVIPPFVPGPPPELFDCTAKETLPTKREWVELSCLLDTNCTNPMVVGHRGVGGNMGTIAPENSLIAIRAAIVMGVDAVELDIRHTSDDELVLMHDTTVSRTTYNEGVVTSFSLAELQGMPLKPPFHPKLKGEFSCAKVPSLSEAFQLTRDRIGIILDTKTERMDLVVPAILEAGMRDQVIISVGDPQKALEARAIDSSVRVQIRPKSTEELEELLPLFERPPEIIEIPVSVLEEMIGPIKANKARVFTDVWIPDAVAYAEKSGQGYLDLYELGAEILQTEYPTQVLQALERWTFDPRCP